VHFSAYPTTLAPAGNFKWRCTNNNPFESNEVYTTGPSAFMRFLGNTNCYVEWVPTPP
jgi:hypothetical protein